MAAEIGLQSLASQQLHHQVGLSILFADVVDGADVGVVERGGRSRLSQEALMGKMDARVRRAQGRRTPDAWFGGQKAVCDELESDFAFESRVQCAVDVTHAAGANLFDYSVGPKDSPGSDHLTSQAFRFTSL